MRPDGKRETLARVDGALPTISETTGDDMDRMLILRGISGTFPDPVTGVARRWDHGALDEPSALAYAQLRGYDGQVLQVSGETGMGSQQTRATLAAFRGDPSVAALYGFSGGGYNVRWVLHDLTPAERRRIRLVVVLGAPKNDPHLYQGAWELVYRRDPPKGHMAGPRALLDSAR